MIFTITRSYSGIPAEWLTKDGSFKAQPTEDELKVFAQYDEALDATVGLQVKHDLTQIKSPCTYSLNRLTELPKASLLPA